ncbi:MDR family NADP-dependent oxidoreductase [Sphingomonas bacterium]|uniref:MDR family NADP-dependent oxidoreductase n=1 Tax=Sphingomonas bacterium TaxID=1895847 RepID=UPI0015773571|nr:NADP-dependent oxidoreductase [Sphingomonas bacterium]
MARIWHLRAQPGNRLDPAIFSLDDVPDRALAPGEVRVANSWLSVDPFMRGMLDEVGGYMPALPLGSPMHGGAVGEVIESRADDWPVGRRLFHNLGWRDISIVPEQRCEAIPATAAPIQRYLGHLGMPGQTAYFGLLDAASAVPGDVLFVSAAAGAVGSAVVQIARIKGMTVIASAAGEDKCAALRSWGADATIDRTAPGTMREKLRGALDAVGAEGITAYFDNVGGDHLNAAIECAMPFARIALCGMLGGYGLGDRLELDQPMRLVIKRLRLRGFAAPDYDDRWAEFHDDMLRWTLSGELHSAETVHDGIESVARAFCGLFAGANLGKMLVRT